MVEQLPLDADPHPTLHEVWTGLAARMPRRAAATLAGLGLGVAAWSRWAGLTWIVTLTAVVVLAFGCDALLWVSSRHRPELQNRRLRVASAVARLVAAVAAVAIGLILLGIVFGDKIEVMRR